MSLNITGPLDLLSLYLTTFDNGRVLLPAGQYEYRITTKGMPTLVWLAEQDSGDLPVCQGGVNTFGTRIMPDGFVLIADVQTEYAEILWQCVLYNPILND